MHCGISFCARKTRKFCSKKCEGLNKSQTTIDNWITNQTSILQITRAIRKYVLLLRDNKCEQCGWNQVHPVTKVSPLEIDHIDGDSENNTITNLRVLCPNCHSLTPTFRALNKGKSKRKR